MSTPYLDKALRTYAEYEVDVLRSTLKAKEEEVAWLKVQLTNRDVWIDELMGYIRKEN